MTSGVAGHHPAMSLVLSPVAGHLTFDPGTGESILVPVGHGATALGRSDDADVKVPSPFVSRRHAVIGVQDGEVVIADAGSAHGTWVNGTRVARAVLQDGDQIALGPVPMRFWRAGAGG